MSFLKKAYRVLTKVEEIFCGILFLLLVVCIVYDVVGRKITGQSLPWLIELSVMIFIAITMIAGSVAVTQDEHPRMNALLVALKGKKADTLNLITDLLCGFFFLFITYYAAKSTINMYNFGTSYVNLPFKVWQAYIFFPLSFIGMAVRSFFRAVFDVRKLRGLVDEEEKEEFKE